MPQLPYWSSCHFFLIPSFLLTALACLNWGILSFLSHDLLFGLLQSASLEGHCLVASIPHTNSLLIDCFSLLWTHQLVTSFLIHSLLLIDSASLYVIILLLLPHTFSSAYCFKPPWTHQLVLPFSYLLFCLLPQLPYIHHLVASYSHLLFCSLIQLFYTHHIVTSSSYLLSCLLLQLPYIHHLVASSSYLLFWLTDSATLWQSWSSHSFLIPSLLLIDSGILIVIILLLLPHTFFSARLL